MSIKKKREKLPLKNMPFVLRFTYCPICKAKPAEQKEVKREENNGTVLVLVRCAKCQNTYQLAFVEAS